MKMSAVTTGAAVLSGLSAPRIYGAVAGSDRIRVGVVGCGGRGPGAALGVVAVITVALGTYFSNRLIRSRAAGHDSTMLKTGV
jgi:hypothetical protein